MPRIDRDSLRAWYRTAMRKRVGELEGLREGLAEGREEARRQARVVGHALRGSGGTFGFDEISVAGALLEDAPDEELGRLAEGMLRLLRATAWPDDPEEHRPFAWMATAAPGYEGTEADAGAAWACAAEVAGVPQTDLARRLASALGVAPPEALNPRPAALRLLPEALLRQHGLIPLDEDGAHLRVATADPVNLAAEADVRRLSGRSPVWVLVPPAAVNAVLGPGEGAPPRAAPRGGEVDPARSPVLLVDDDPAARIIARAVLQRKEHPVWEAADGETALALFEEHPDTRLAVVDLEMPGMGGRELVRRLRATEAGAHLGIIVLTGSKDPDLEAELMEGGADDYLEKPLDPRLFMARVAATLRRTGGAWDA